MRTASKKIICSVSRVEELLDKLKELSLQEGGAWVIYHRPFHQDFELHQYKSPSSVPDFYIDIGFIHDLKHVPIGYKGKIVNFSKTALIREQNRALGCE